VPSEITATILALDGRVPQRVAVVGDRARDARDPPGVYAIERSSRVLSSMRERIASLPPR
jgi:hypothetical protein